MNTTPDVSRSPPATRSPTRRGHESPPTVKAARAEAEAANAQLQSLLALTDTALSHLALDDLLRELLGRVTAVMRGDQMAIFLLDEDGQTLTLRAARGVLEEMSGHGRVTLGRGFIGRIAASRKPEILNAPADADFYGVPPQLREQMRALVGVPLLVADP